MHSSPWLAGEQRREIVMFARRHGFDWKQGLRYAWDDRLCPDGLIPRELRDTR